MLLPSDFFTRAAPLFASTVFCTVAMIFSASSVFGCRAANRDVTQVNLRSITLLELLYVQMVRQATSHCRLAMRKLLFLMTGICSP